MTLLENSISFFQESIVNAIQSEKEVSKWKISLLLLVQAIETILKARLKETHEILIYEKIDQPKHTVSLDLALERLEKISHIKLNNDDKKNIKTATELRNQIVHFEFDLSIEQIKSNFVSLVGFYISFAQKNLKYDILSGLPNSLKQELLELDSYVEELEKRAIERITNEEIPDEWRWECPACKKYTFVAYDEIDSCYLCGYKERVVECEFCRSVYMESETEEIDFGNMKGLENYKIICQDCQYKIDSEDPYQEYY